jgi:hypothetical protein
MSIKRIFGVLSLILLAAPVMPGLPASLASPGITPGVPSTTASNTSDARGAGVRAAAAEDPLVTETRKLMDTFVQLWKENKLEDLVAGYFTEDPLMLPPNHEPIRGRQAILAYFKNVRDAIGEFDPGDYLIRATPIGDNSISWAGQFSFHHGQLRSHTAEVWVLGQAHDGFALAFRAGLHVDNGATRESNFHDFKWSRMFDSAPEMSVHILPNSNVLPGGIGEVGIPAATAAAANAWARATGKQPRNFPLNEHGA